MVNRDYMGLGPDAAKKAFHVVYGPQDLGPLTPAAF